MGLPFGHLQISDMGFFKARANKNAAHMLTWFNLVDPAWVPIPQSPFSLHLAEHIIRVIFTLQLAGRICLYDWLVNIPTCNL